MSVVLDEEGRELYFGEVESWGEGSDVGDVNSGEVGEIVRG